MATILYFDCFSGISGDMLLGACLDAGLPLDELKSALGSLAMPGYDIHARRVLRCGVSATKFEVREARHDHGDSLQSGHHHHDHDHPHAHRSLPEIFALIERSALPPSGRERARGLFQRLAEAEAAIHQMPVDEVHLHEVGALDSIIDIVGAVFALEWIGADRIISSPLNVGGGMVTSTHGVFPVPAPATVRLLGDAPIYGGTVQKELVTPTGALLVTSYASSFGPVPPMSVERVGYGAGTRDNPETPNVLRLLVGRAATEGTSERVVVLECEIDDMNPQIFGVVMDHLYAAGALDVYYTPVQMKKNRPGTLLTVVAPLDRHAALATIIFEETTTIGLRRHEVERERLVRETITVETPVGCVRFKLAHRDGRVVNAAPEFDDCAALAVATGRTVKDIQALAIQSYGARAHNRGAGLVSRFYITTPIYYINAEPHLGHAYTTLVADAVARAHRLLGDDVFFLTGTDEHGQKVARAAQKAGLTPPAFADRLAAKFSGILPTLNVANDDFIRTTEPRHYAAAQALWRRVKERGFIYKGKYEGLYCTVDEVFVPETQLKDGRCPICGNPVETIAEESYFFRLSAFQQPLLDYYRQHPDFVTPAIRRNEMLSFLEAGLDDLSVSRTSFTWGIPVPDDPGHVMYVWFDALTNYMTAAGYGGDGPAAAERFETWWPADVHLIGKEIVRQHAIYWPAFLLAADLPLPHQIVSHGWWLMDGAKMSKSKGNVVRPQDYIERFGLDAVRYFVFREMVFGQDASFTDDGMLTRYNADLANDLGNLVSRVITMVQRYAEGVVPAADRTRLARPEEQELLQLARETAKRVTEAVCKFELSAALRDVWELIGAGNRYVVLREPWKLAKTPAQRAELETALYVTADLVRVVAELLRPFMPLTAERTLETLGVRPASDAWRTLTTGALEAGTRLGPPVTLFPRIAHSVEELRSMSTDNPTAAGPAAPEPVVPAAVGPAGEPAPAAPPPAPAATDRISIDDFMKVELRVAKVLSAERVPKSKKLLKLHVDTGADQRTIVAGIAESYEPDVLVGRTIVVVANLKPATLMGVESNGMVLAGSIEGGKPVLVGFDQEMPPGTRVR